jgi:hypothetical protein
MKLTSLNIPIPKLEPTGKEIKKKMLKIFLIKKNSKNISYQKLRKIPEV